MIVNKEVAHEPHFDVSQNSASEEELVFDVGGEGWDVVVCYVDGLERTQVASRRVVRPALHVPTVQRQEEGSYDRL